MMVSMIQSNFRGMGSGLVADGLGFMFQDRGQLFSLQRRPSERLCAGQAAVPDDHPRLRHPRTAQPWLSFGVMGGDMQPQGQAQIIVNRVDYGLDIQAAGDSPRWHHEGSSQSMGEDAPGMPATGLLRLESGVPAATRTALAAHRLADRRIRRRLRPLRMYRAPHGRRRTGSTPPPARCAPTAARWLIDLLAGI